MKFGGGGGGCMNGGTVPALAVSLMLAPVLTLAPGEARAQTNDCGTPTNGELSCADQAWSSGITEDAGASSLTLIVGGGTATTVTAPAGASRAVNLDSGSGATGNNLELRVGSAGAVAIVKAASGTNDGLRLQQQGSGTATIDVRSTVTIGSQSNQMSGRGIELQALGAGAASITNAAAIHAAGDGIHLRRTTAGATSAATTIVNSGDIRTGADGIEVSYLSPGSATPTGGVSITNSGDITVTGGGQGIRLWGSGSFEPNGEVRIDNRGDITSTSMAGTGGGIDLRLGEANAASTGDVIVDNSGAITADYALRLVRFRSGDVTLTNTGDLESTSYHGIHVESCRTGCGTHSGDVTVTSSGDVSAMGISTVRHRGIFVEMNGNGAGRVTATGGSITSAAGQGIYLRSQGTGAVTISSGADVTAATHGIHADKAGSRATAGDVSITATGGSITAGTDGIRAGYETSNDDNGAISVTVATGTTVTAARTGIYVANAGLDEAAAGTGDDVLKQTVAVHGMVTGGAGAAVHLMGGGTLTVGATGRVIAGAGQPAILVNGPGRSVVTIDGEVRGSDGADAAVALSGGGRVTVGPTGSVDANGAGSAIRLGGGTYQVAVYATGAALNKKAVDEAIARVRGGIATGAGGSVTDREGVAGRVSYAVVETLGDYTTGRYLPLELDADGEPITEGDAGYAALPTDCGLSGDRCRLYEALPSTLLAMNGVPTYGERMAAARDARGGWVRVEAARGKWKADRSTQPDVAYDHRRSGVRAGMDFAMGDGAGRVGVSVHGLRSSAEMAGVGEIELAGSGVGVSATRTFAGGIHVDAQAAVTWYEADLKSTHPAFLRAMPLGTLKNDVDGRGYALGVEVGKALAVLDGGVTVTPRVGLRWSKVGLDGFTDETGRRVSVKDAQSLKGRAGAGVEKVLEGAGGMDGSRLFGSLDVEREFREETEVGVMGSSPLKASAKKTRLRAAAGAVHVWGEGRYALQGSLGYTAGVGGNRDVGAGVSLRVRF